MTKTTRIRFVHDCRVETVDKMSGDSLAGPPTRTVAMRGLEGGAVEVGVALCHPNDQFSRRAGRVKAQGRLEGRAQAHFFVVEDLDGLIQALDADGQDSTPELEFCFSLVVRDLTDSRFVESVRNEVCS